MSEMSLEIWLSIGYFVYKEFFWVHQHWHICSPSQCYPGYQRFFLSLGGRKSFASLRHRKLRKKNLWCPGISMHMTEKL